MEIRPIPLASLLINTENPRFEVMSSQLEAIHAIIEDQSEKIARLAEHIMKHGLNPADLIMVTPYDIDDSFFVVLEGNRRIAALKLLNNPGLIPDKHKVVSNRIKKLSESLDGKQLDDITCAVFEDDTEAYEWIFLKHSGELEGVGTVNWDAQQKARFEAKIKGKSSYALQIIEFLYKQEIDTEIKNNLSKLHSSSLQRLLADPDVREVIGISIDDGKIVTQLSPDEVIKPLKKITADLLADDFTVKNIYLKQDRIKYLKTFGASNLPNKHNIAAGKWELKLDNPPAKSSPQSKGKGGKSASTKRTTIIPRHCIIHIDQPRSNEIYRELKRLSLTSFRNSGAVLFRVFVEFTVDAFIDKFKPLKVTIDSKLWQKVGAVATELETNSHLSHHQLKGIRTSVSNENSIMSINTFNSYVHNQHFSPAAEDLKTTWDNMELFIKKVWELL